MLLVVQDIRQLDYKEMIIVGKHIMFTNYLQKLFLKRQRAISFMPTVFFMKNVWNCCGR